MSTISKMETPTGQEETAILLEEQARRIATLQESLKQACHNPHSNDRVIMQEVDRLVKERDDLKRKLANAELLIERLKEDNEQYKFDLDLYNNADAKALAIWRENHPDPSKCFVPGLGKMLVWLMDEIYRLRGLIDNTTANQPEVITKLGKALQDIDVTKRILVENSCPSEFGLQDCENNPESGCTLCCEDCWNQEVES